MKFDIVLGGDWRLQGGIMSGVAHEFRALRLAGYSIGLVQLDTRLSSVPWSESTEFLDFERKLGLKIKQKEFDPIQADLLCLHHPAALLGNEETLVRITAGLTLIIAQRPPLDAFGRAAYDLADVESAALTSLGDNVRWAPISGVCRSNLAAARPSLGVIPEDWVHFVISKDWYSTQPRFQSGQVRIGRHSRPQTEKWPDSRESMLMAYPDKPDIIADFLGGGSRLRELVGELPETWILREWNAIAPADYLKTLDVFVYYHHPRWVEGFGRNILEALASGCPAILPPYFEATFGDAALYSEAEDVHENLERVRSDRLDRRRQISNGFKRIDQKFSQRRFLEVAQKYLEHGRRIGRASAIKTHGTSKLVDRPIMVSADQLRRQEQDVFDVAYIADFTSESDSLIRICEEAKINSGAGLRTLFVQFPLRGRGNVGLAPLVKDIVLGQRALYYDRQNERVRSKLTVVSLSSPVTPDLAKLAGRFAANFTVALCEADYRGNPGLDNEALETQCGKEIIWSCVRSKNLRKLDSLKTIEGVWTPSLIGGLSRRNPSNREIRIGVLGVPTIDGLRSFEQSISFAAANVTTPLRFVVRTCLAGAEGLNFPTNWTLVNPNRIGYRKFLDRIDFLACYPEDQPIEVYATAIAIAQSKNVPVLLSEEDAEVVGAGPIYAPLQDVIAICSAISRSENGNLDDEQPAAAKARKKYGASHHLGRLKRFGLVESAPPLVRPPEKQKTGRVMLLTSNGTGLGHVTRQLAIARRLPAGIEPIFATMSKGLSLIKGFGYPAEYIPSQSSTESGQDNWNDWLERDLERLIDFYDPDLVAFDGNVPPKALPNAIGSRDTVALAWIRRPMWRSKRLKGLADEIYFDLILEPGEIASSRDKGATTLSEACVKRVPPIRLLDESDLLSKAEAMDALGLDQSKPAVLVQVGSGSNRDVVSLIDGVINQLRQFSDLQIVLAEWNLAEDRLDLWPDTTVVRGFPFSQYLRAFDFTISAAGYNTFHEVMEFEIPTIFLANDHPSMDDQTARAAFAEDYEAAIKLDLDSVHELQDLVPIFLNERARGKLIENCQKLETANGAKTAADTLASMITVNG